MEDEATTRANTVVAVTGGTGYLATEILFQLVSRGYTVRATVRSLESDSARSLQSLLPSVRLFEAELLKEGSFVEAFRDAHVVIHTASPFPMKVVDAQKELIEPALNGTLNVLGAVDKCGTVKRVVVTGSCASVVEHYPKEVVGKVWSEDDWNTTSTLTDGPYRLSKVVAEKYTWEWAASHPNITVATILPTFIIGPPRTTRADATSIKVFMELLDGTTKAAGGVPPSSFGSVDVRDVATAHISAFEKSATGRFILSSTKGTPRVEYARILKKTYPTLPIPDNQIGEIVEIGGAVLTGSYSNQKSKQILKIEYTPFETSVVEMAKKMIELGMVKTT